MLKNKKSLKLCEQCGFLLKWSHMLFIYLYLKSLLAHVGGQARKHTV